MADWNEVVRRMEESAARIRKAQADKEAKRITIQRVGKGDTFILSKPEKYDVPYDEPHGVIRVIG